VLLVEQVVVVVDIMELQIYHSCTLVVEVEEEVVVLLVVLHLIRMDITVEREEL
jgi:hypothetical protein